ncbi:MAG: hypothetical protein A3J83_04420 [Elusimicrobia bacterium RIFOXYA2_FULL_40_6]|nr:MAG: hypothetical protein A3J83_04420 [Elusimicrobia bacterium RIFOXYA2_FULL_40_6]
MPIPPQGRKVEVFGEGCLVISNRTQHPDEAFRFVKYYCGEKGMKIFGLAKNGIPALRKAAQETFVTPPPAHAKYFIDIAEKANYPVTLKMASASRFFVPYEQYNELLFLGKISVDECVKKITKDTDDLLREIK